MSDTLQRVLDKNPGEKEFHQAVTELYESIEPILEKNGRYRKPKIFERLTEPERIITFRVTWLDDKGEVQVNRGYRIQMSSTLGPYKGGLRFHPSVNLSILKFLAFEQVFKNSLTTLNLGGGKGGSDFDPKGKSDNEIMKFCQSFMNELFRHIGEHTDIPAGDIGVGSREIGYLFGQYKRIMNRYTGVLTGKKYNWAGSLIRNEATGYGLIYFASYMMEEANLSLEGKLCLVSGSGNVAQYATEKLIEMKAKVVTLSDSSGYIYDEEGIDRKKLTFVKKLKNEKRGRIKEYVNKYSNAVYTPHTEGAKSNPLWTHKADCAFPCATQNELNSIDARHLVKNKIRLVAEGANMPCTPEAIEIFIDSGVLYAPGKATNAGGVAVSGLEMAQNAMKLQWESEEVDKRLQDIMRHIHMSCLRSAEKYGKKGNYLAGANIAGFLNVADAMIDLGVV